MIYSTSELMQKYSNYADAKGKIRRLVRDGKLIQFARGLYEDNAATDPAYLASWIYSPSYLSFDYVLYIHDLIPETVHTLTSATFNKRKMKIYKNAFGIYTYQDVPKLAYPHCVIAEVSGNYSYQVATCEKALCDKLYTLSPARNMKEFKYLLFDDLRIDQDDFWNLNMDDISYLAPLYHSANLKYLLQLIRKGKNDQYN